MTVPLGSAGDDDAPVDRLASDGGVPTWWVIAFAMTIAVAAGTWLASSFGITPGPLDRYVADRAAALDTGELVSDAMLDALARDDLAIRGGSRAFAQHCTRCHGARAQGDVGPNLTDDRWIAGGSPRDIYTSIVAGRIAQGMPAWGAQLGRGACKQVAAYLLSIRGTNVPGKPAQGASWTPPSTPATDLK